jgi:hypothetical protein
MKKEMLASIQKNPAYSSSCVDHWACSGGGCDSIETEPCSAYAPASLETYQDDDYI